MSLSKNENNILSAWDFQESWKEIVLQNAPEVGVYYLNGFVCRVRLSLFFQQIWESSDLSLCTGWQKKDVETSNLLWNSTGFGLHLEFSQQF